MAIYLCLACTRLPIESKHVTVDCSNVSCWKSNNFTLVNTKKKLKKQNLYPVLRMRMTLTEMSMHEAFFYCDASKKQCSVPACEAFPSNNYQIWWETWSHEDEWNRKSTQRPPRDGRGTSRFRLESNFALTEKLIKNQAPSFPPFFS